MNENELTKLYTDHRTMIWNRAWSFSRRFNADVEELFSVGNLAFMECADKWDDAQGTKFSTYLYSALNNSMLHYLKRNRENNISESDEERVREEADPQNLFRAIELRDELRHLRGPVQLVVELALSDDLDETSGKAARGRITREMRARGYKWHDIWSSMNEAKQLIRS